jgi:hypothetical protein
MLVSWQAGQMKKEKSVVMSINVRLRIPVLAS